MLTELQPGSTYASQVTLCHAHRLAGLEALVLVRAPLRPAQHPLRPAARVQRRHRRPRHGFETHPHRDMEIVTWVLDGALVHQDSEGHNGVDLPRPRAADERRHRHPALREERRLALDRPDAHDDPVHFIQMWVLPDENGIAARLRAARDRRPSSLRGGLVPVASGMAEHADESAIRIGSATPRCTPPGSRPASRWTLPDAPVRPPLRRPRRPSTLEGAGPLATGDAVRITGGGGPARHGHRATPRCWSGRCTPESSSPDPHRPGIDHVQHACGPVARRAGIAERPYAC